MSLLTDIYLAQRNAGEDTAIVHLEAMGLLQKPDVELTPDQLSEKYNPDGGGQHPEHTRADWRDEVLRDHTLRGYWDWVSAQLEEDQCS